MTIIKNIILFLFGLFGTFIIIEIYITLAEISKTNWTVVDPEIGKTNKPDADVIFFSEGFYMGRINHYGYLGKDYKPLKEKDKFRIALIGDSFVEGMQVFTRHHFMSLLENNLNSGADNKYQVLNFGKGIFDFNDMYCYYENFVSEFNPDIVYLFVSAKDFEESKKEIMPSVSLQNDSIKIQYDFMNSDQYKRYTRFNFFMKSSIGRLAFNCYKIRNNSKSILFEKFYKEQVSDLPQEYNYLNLTDVQKKIIEQMGGSQKFVFVYLNKIPKQIDDFLKKNVETIELSPSFKILKEQGLDPLYWKATNKYGHINHEGHKVVAELLCSDMANRVLTKK